MTRYPVSASGLSSAVSSLVEQSTHRDVTAQVQWLPRCTLGDIIRLTIDGREKDNDGGVIVWDQQLTGCVEKLPGNDERKLVYRPMDRLRLMDQNNVA